jgi:hypothetical protein
MRKITKNAANAFIAGRTFKESNTTVKIEGKTVTLLLHDHVIAERVGVKGLYISACGWLTSVTKERLNGLPGVSIQQKSWKWYLNGKEWDGSRILIKP